MKTPQTHLISHAWPITRHRRTRVSQAARAEGAEIVRGASLRWVKTRSELVWKHQSRTETMRRRQRCRANSPSYVQFTDLVEETSIDPYLTEAAQVLGEQAGSTIDILIRNVMTAGTNIRFAGGVGSRGAVTASSILNSSEVRRANRTLHEWGLAA